MYTITYSTLPYDKLTSYHKAHLMTYEVHYPTLFRLIKPMYHDLHDYAPNPSWTSHTLTQDPNSRACNLVTHQLINFLTSYNSNTCTITYIYIYPNLHTVTHTNILDTILTCTHNNILYITLRQVNIIP